MPPKRKPVKKPRQKQKQKQIVKQNVRVNVQSSGGSGGGGSSGQLPMTFRDTAGESQRLLSLVEQIAARSRGSPIQIAAPAREPVRFEVPVPPPREEAYAPQNDASTFGAVYNAPINFDRPIHLGPSESESEMPSAKARKVRSDAGKSRKPKAETYQGEFAGYTYPSESEMSASPSGFQEPFGFPARSRFTSEMEAKQKLGLM